MIPSKLVGGLSTATTAAKATLPIVICGKNPGVSLAVTAGLQPDYRVAHSILSPAAGVRDLPRLLQRGNSTTEQETTPVAVLVGGGYTDEDLKSMQDACQETPSITWLKVRPTDMSGPLPPFAEYGAKVGRTARDFLNQLRSKGELGKGQTCYL